MGAIQEPGYTMMHHQNEPLYIKYDLLFFLPQQRVQATEPELQNRLGSILPQLSTKF